MDRVVAKLEMVLRERLLKCCNGTADSVLGWIEDRESSKFDTEWMDSFRLVSEVVLDASQSRQLDALRELAFKSTYRKTQSADLAAFVADDFEIIARGHLIDSSNELLLHLENEYFEGRFPHTLP